MINLSQRSLLALFSRIVLGVVLIYASIDKIIHPEAFAKLIGNYNVCLLYTSPSPRDS